MIDMVRKFAAMQMEVIREASKEDNSVYYERSQNSGREEVAPANINNRPDDSFDVGFGQLDNDQ